MDMPDVAAEFDVTIDIIHLTISVFVFGECCLALAFPSSPFPDTSAPLLPYRFRNWPSPLCSLKRACRVSSPLQPLACCALSLTFLRFDLFRRRPVIIISMALYFVFTFPSAFAKNAATLVVGRAIAGLAASAPMTGEFQLRRDSARSCLLPPSFTPLFLLPFPIPPSSDP